MKTGTLLLLLLTGAMLFGCSTARIPVPDSLSDAERLPVEGRQGLKIRERLRFGPYEAAEIKRSWTRGSDLSVMIYEGNKRVQRFTFVLQADNAPTWDVSCGAFLRMRTGHFPEVDVAFENRSELDCTLQALHADETWTLSLRGEDEQPLAGVLHADDSTLDVRGTRRLQKALSPGTTTGYEILDGIRATAAVEVINAGAVWLENQSSPSERDLLAATAASLLLYEDLRAHVSE